MAASQWHASAMRMADFSKGDGQIPPLANLMNIENSNGKIAMLWRDVHNP